MGRKKVVCLSGHKAIGEPMDGHQDLIWGRPKWKEGVVSSWKGLIEFVCHILIEGRKGSSRGVKVGRHHDQGQRVSGIDCVSEPEGEGTISLSKNRDCDIGSCGGNGEGVLIWERGGGWGEQASMGTWEQGCSLYGGNRGADAVTWRSEEHTSELQSP